MCPKEVKTIANRAKPSECGCVFVPSYRHRHHRHCPVIETQSVVHVVIKRCRVHR